MKVEAEPATGILSVVLPLAQDRPPEESVQVGILADELGYSELWIGEMATYDAFALGTAIGLQTSRIPMTLGPFAVSVRTPMTVAMGAASVANLTGRQVGVALGTSSDVVVKEWHGRDRRRPATMLSEHAAVTKVLMSGERSEQDGELISSKGYRLRLDPVSGPLSIAAFGPLALQAAAMFGDRLLLNMLTVQGASRLCEQLATEAAKQGRPTPRTAIWLSTSVDPTEEAVGQLLRSKVGYLAAPGYSQMFEEAGFAEIVAFARTRPHPREVLAAMPTELAASVGLVGTVDEVRSRILAYMDAGVDEICIVPGTVGDDAGERTLRALAPVQGMGPAK
jgi:probable F420-dependent oxidoreductase